MHLLRRCLVELSFTAVGQSSITGRKPLIDLQSGGEDSMFKEPVNHETRTCETIWRMHSISMKNYKNVKIGR
jgi:hypothetical protein